MLVGLWILEACFTPAGRVHAPVGVEIVDTARPDTQRNLLLVVVDDLGVDRLPSYGATEPELPSTPTLDRLMDEGVTFEQTWSEPLCSPSRASMLTGQHGQRYGLGTAVRYADTVDLPLSAETLAEALPDHDSAFIGKWHLTAGPEGLTAPTDQGFDHWTGSLGNLVSSNSPEGLEQGYWDWERVVSGEIRRETGYATTVLADAAIDWLADRSDPWLLVLSFHAGHAPYHAPPIDLVAPDRPRPDGVPGRHSAMIEALDHELGRVVDAISEEQWLNTSVVWVGDNGTPDGVTGELAKGTVYEAGVHVPMVITGPGVAAGQRTQALAHVVDVFPTLVELGTGVSPQTVLDGRSLVDCLTNPDRCSPRDMMVTASFTPNGEGVSDSWQWAARGPRYKLMQAYHETVQPEGMVALFDMMSEGESVNLLDSPLSKEAETALGSLEHAVQEARVGLGQLN